ncbi:hypothetical protein [Microbulbifer litoralis]|uniref:hypothetical protein n=1 Tax=Microbulbifer litoralis TaxID=2933965 RepID=UPI0020276F84|nr:hypothetical protein [Microbulbifer sp. GX H0434]
MTNSKPLSEREKQFTPVAGETDPRDAAAKARAFASREKLRLKTQKTNVNNRHQRRDDALVYASLADPVCPNAHSNLGRVTRRKSCPNTLIVYITEWEMCQAAHFIL